MRFVASLPVGFAYVLLVSVGCSSSNDMINPPVADAACSNLPGHADRFVDCGNGTVTDTQTHLIWLRDDCPLVSHQDWYAATDSAGTLAHLEDGECGLSDHSSAGSWRLPTLTEWQAIVKSSCGPPTIPDKAGTGCYATGTQWASGVRSSFYWSSSTVLINPGRAWGVYLLDGSVFSDPNSNRNDVWPVRGGQ